MEKIITLERWDFTPALLYILVFIGACYLQIKVRPTRDILLENDEEIKREVLNTKREVLASNQYIIDILEKKQKQF